MDGRRGWLTIPVMGGSGWREYEQGRPGAYSDPVHGARRYGPPPGGPYGSGSYGSGSYGSRRSGTTALVLGILGLVLCGLLAPVAWIYGSGAVEDNAGTPDEGLARAGQILGVVGTVVLLLSLLWLLLIVASAP